MGPETSHRFQGWGLSPASVPNLLGREGETKTSRLKELKVMLNSNLWALLTSSHGLQSGPRSQPRAETSVPTAPNPNKLHRTVGFGKFCFLFPHISGVGVFSKTQTHLLTKREKKLGEQGACGQRSDPSSPRAMPGSPSSLLPAPNGCHRLLLAISRLFVFNIYLHLPFPSHPPPTLLLQQLFCCSY